MGTELWAELHPHCADASPHVPSLWITEQLLAYVWLQFWSVVFELFDCCRYPRLISKLKILLFSGDVDECVPYNGAEQWTRGFGYDEVRYKFSHDALLDGSLV